MNNIFDFNRFSLLLKRELWSGNKKPLIVAGAVFGFSMVQALFMIYLTEGYEFLNFNWFMIVLLGGGLVFTSVIFNEFNDKTGTHHYLSLPASTFEKFLSKWFISAIIFPIIVIILFSIYTTICDNLYINFMASKYNSDVTDIPLWKLTDWWSIFFLKLYFVGQSFFLVGAIVFQKYTFFKTALTGWLATILFAIFIAIAIRIIFAEFFDTLYMPREDVVMIPNDSTLEFLDHKLSKWFEFILWFLVAPIMWTVGFFKLKEKEA